MVLANASQLPVNFISRSELLLPPTEINLAMYYLIILPQIDPEDYYSSQSRSPSFGRVSRRCITLKLSNSQRASIQDFNLTSP